MSGLSAERADANQGDFFFAKFLDPSTGRPIPHPVFVVGKNSDSNDDEDVIICKCTSQPKRSDYDIPVSLKKPTFVRTNKLYTIRRSLLQFKITHSLDSSIIGTLLKSVEKAVNKDTTVPTLYECPICFLHYINPETAKQCEVWCKEHHSCNLEITKSAVELS